MSRYRHVHLIVNNWPKKHRFTRNTGSSGMNYTPSRIECEISIKWSLLSAESSAAFVHKLLITFPQQRILRRVQHEKISLSKSRTKEQKCADFEEIILKMWQLGDEQGERGDIPFQLLPFHVLLLQRYHLHEWPSACLKVGRCWVHRSGQVQDSADACALGSKTNNCHPVPPLVRAPAQKLLSTEPVQY